MLQKMTIKQTIWVLPIIAAIIFAIGAAISYRFDSQTSSNLSSALKNDFPVLEKARALSFDLAKLEDLIRSAVSEGSIDLLSEGDTPVTTFLQEANDLSKYTGQEKMADSLKTELLQYHEAAKKAATAIITKDTNDVIAKSSKKIDAKAEEEAAAEIATLTNDMQNKQKTVRASVESLIQTTQSQLNGSFEASELNLQRAIRVNLLTAVCVLIALALLAYFVVARVWRVLGGEPTELQAIAQHIAEGDFSTPINVQSKDTNSVMAKIADMQTNLSQLIAEVKETAESISVGAQEISAGNTNLSQRTEEQASSLEETASSMEEMASTVKQNAENAKQANTMATEASAVAIKGGNAVNQVVTTMADINSSSKKIVDIISVIDGIAFQTNILALNAAVEAARAGEQGRGFAVVAAEVRSLAQRSATAAKEIKQLIGDSVEKVSNGTLQVQEAGKTIAEVVTSVKMVTDIVNEIAAASQEQSSGIDQVNNAITNMDEVVQQNAALVEQAAAAANSLEAKAQELTDATSLFKLATNQRQQAIEQTSAQNNAQHLNKLNQPAANILPKTKQTRLKPPKAKKDEEWEEF
jgi:methyl-accepting chemotaxis protein